jgi:hypothetical protein
MLDKTNVEISMFCCCNPIYASSRLPYIKQTNKLADLNLKVYDLFIQWQLYRSVRRIQSLGRGYLGRKFIYYFKSKRRREKILKRYANEKEVFSIYFEQNGAAVIIQRWYTNLAWRSKAAWRKKYSKWIIATTARHLNRMKKRRRYIPKAQRKKGVRKDKISKDLTADLKERGYKLELKFFLSVEDLNRVVRGFIGRQKFNKLMKIKKSRIKIQTWIRMFLVYCRYPGLGNRYRSLVKKERIWCVQLKIDVPIHLQRREGFLYQSLQIGDKKNMIFLQSCVLKIEKAYKSRLIRRSFSNMFTNRDFLKVNLIASWFRTWQRRKLVAQAIFFLQPLWRFKASKTLTLKRAAIKIQSKQRFIMARRRVRLFRIQKTHGKEKLYRFLLTTLLRRRIKKEIRNRRFELENSSAGVKLFEKSLHLKHIDMIWAGVRKTRSVDVQHELQRFFIIFSKASSLDQSGAFKIAKECNLLEGNLDKRSYEMLFTKCKELNEQRLQYKNFLDFCCALGTIKFIGLSPEDIPSFAGGAPLEGSKNDVKVKNNPKIKKKVNANSSVDVLMNSFKYGRLLGKPALAVKFIFNYIFTSIEYPKVVVNLKSKGSLRLAKNILENKGIRLVLWLRIRLGIKRMTRVSKATKLRKLNEIKRVAANNIQTFIKGFLGRRFLMRMAQTMYTKYIDGESQMPYWFNPRTGKAFWTKPTLLGPFDCGLPVPMPHIDEQFLVPCSSCADATSTFFCNECNDTLCGPCFLLLHKSAKKAHHVNIELTNCIQCDFQAGTRYCVNCEDSYCDECNKYVHSKGRLRLHIQTWGHDPCQNCNSRGSKWNFFNNIEETNTKFCIPCYKSSYGEPVESEYVTPVKFYGKSVVDYRKAAEDERIRIQIAAQYKQQKEMQRIRKRVNACTSIQRVFRGNKVRATIAEFLQSRRDFFILREEEMSKRTGIMYKLLEFWGIAPSLESDTTVEKAKKCFPGHMLPIVQESLDYKWKFACSLVHTQEEFLKTPESKASKSDKKAAEEKSRIIARSIKLGQTDLQKAKQLREISLKKWRDGKAASTTKMSKLQKLETDFNDSEKAIQDAEDVIKTLEEDHIKAKEKIFLMQGPETLKEYVNDKRSNGVSLPFTVTTYYGSNLISTNWEEDEVSDESIVKTKPKPKHDLLVDDSQDKNKHWKDYLKEGDYILINSQIYQIIAKEKRKKKKINVSPTVKFDSDGKVLEVNEENVLPSSDEIPSTEISTSLMDTNKTDEGDMGGAEFNTLGALAMFGSQGPGVGDDEVDGDDEGGGDRIEEEVVKERKSIHDPLPVLEYIYWTEDHITLDRPWVVEGEENIEICKVLPKAFYEAPIYFIYRLFMKSFPAQKGVAITAITMYKIATLNRWIGTLFDEDSDVVFSLENRATKYHEYKNEWLQMSRSVSYINNILII